jgi:Ca2+-transporting ATPase
VGLALLAPVFGLPLLLMPVHLVWLELIVHPVSALLFQGDPPPEDLMRRPPRDPRAPMLPARSLARSVISGGLLTALTFAVYLWRQPDGAPRARAVAFATLILGYQLLVLAERAASGRGPLLPRSFRFWLIWAATGLSLPILLYVPAAAALADVAPLPPRDWLIALAGAAVSLGWRLVGRR